MTRSMTQAWLVCCLATFALAGCASDTTSTESTGALSLALEIDSGVEIDEVVWTITSPDMEDMSGTINTSAPRSTASVEVFGLPPGDDYNVELEAMSEDGTTCRGDADFEVEVGETEFVKVYLNCKRPETLGGVRVNGDFNICAELAKVIVSPLQTSLGNDIDLSAIGQDVEDNTIDYLWTGTGGSIDNASATETTYTCEELGDQIITITVSDDDFDYCMHSWAVDVTCVVGDGPDCVENADCDIDEICVENECVPDLDCIGNEDCDEGEICVDNECVPDLDCVGNEDCDEGEICVDNVCVPDLDCVTDDDCGPLELCVENACIAVDCKVDDDCGTDEVCIVNGCYGDPDLFCDENLCALDDDARADCIQAFILCVEGEPANEEGCVVFARLKCNECNEDSDCDAGEVCSDDKICVSAPLDCEYIQDFEDLVQSDPLALNDDGWLAFENIFNPDGSGPIEGSFVSPTPNGGPGFAAIADGQGGPDQGQQQLTIYSNYNNGTAQEAGNRVEANTFRERSITMDDVGKTLTFSFDAKRGNINDETTENCMVTPNAPCDSTAVGFIKTLDPSANFFTTNFITEDTSDLPTTWGRKEIQLPIDAGLVGQLLQVGFSATAQNFEPSGNFYDNVAVCFAEDNGGGGECVPPALPNLTVNGDFETGDFCGWSNFCDNASCTITDQNPNSGEFAANVNVANANQAGVIKQFLIGEGEVQAGDALDISLFIRGEVGAGGLLFVTLFSELPDGGVTDRKDFGPFFPTADWVEIPISTTVGGDPSGGITLELAAQSGASFINLFVDDVSVVIVDP